MSRLNKLVSSLAGTVLLCVNLGFGGHTQNPVRGRKVPKTHLEGLGFDGLLADLAVKYGITIGVEDFRSDVSETDYRTSMDLPSGRLGSLVDRIIATDSRYRWNEINGVIQVYPTGRREDLLDVVIHEFSREGNFLQAQIADEICNLPEVKSKMNALGISAFNPLPISMIMGADYTDRYSVHVHDVTVRDLLNEIAKSSKYHFWAIGRWSPENKIVTLEF
jgi:hypothetical protein